MNRRDLLKAAVPAVALTAIPAAASISALAPFVTEDSEASGTWALCYPCDQVSHAGRYVLQDGRIVRAERFHGLWVDAGAGWAEVSPAAFNALVVGKVVSTHGRVGDAWQATGTGA